MSVTTRAAISNTGPRSGTSWYNAGENVYLATYALNASQTATVNGTSEQIVFVVPTPSTSSVNYTYSADALASDNVTANLGGIQMVSQATLSASTSNLTLSFFLRRAGSVIGGGAFAGWAANGNAAFTAFVPVVVPFLTANTALKGAQGGAATSSVAFLPLQPADVLTFSVVSNGSVNVPFFNILLDIA